MTNSSKKSWLSDLLIITKIVAMIAIPTALLMIHVTNQYRVTELGYEIAQVTAEHRQLIEANKKLTLEAGVQGRSDRLAQMARREFGLVDTRPEQIISVSLDDQGAETSGAPELAAVRPGEILRVGDESYQ